MHRNRGPDLLRFDADTAELPFFDFEVVQAGNDIVPVDRGVRITGHPRWNVVLGAGRAWNEPDDQGFSRASLPFALQEVNANCTHNGLLTFLYRSGGQISNAVIQVSSETCAYLQFDLWASHSLFYAPGESSDAERIRSDYQDEVLQRMAVAPLSSLADRYPDVAPSKIGSEIDPSSMTTYGFIIDGVHYSGGCPTRHGPYPYCESLHLPSYSLAKSAFAGLAFMRLAHLYPGSPGEVIADWVPACSDTGTWKDVTFENAIDMATGNLADRENHKDEESLRMLRFLREDEHRRKVRSACRAFSRQAAPGSTWVYHTSDTYILTAAMQAFLDDRLAGADIFHDVVYLPIFEPLGMSPVSGSTLRTLDETALPLGGLGLTFQRDDVADLATFLLKGKGTIDGRTVVEPELLEAALQRDPGNRGLVAINEGFRYNNGFWAWNAAELLDCPTPVWIPYMSGYGGITFALFPNQSAYYYFSDGYVFRWAEAVMVSHQIRSMCPAQ